MILHKAKEHIYDAEQAMAMLKAGNARYVENRLCDKTKYEMAREELADAQNPFAVVICCSDSRVAPELFFDQRLGDIFVIRNAGNIVDNVVLGSVEYAVEALHCPLVVVCGHSHCGAVGAACHGGHKFPHMESLMKRIQPAVEAGGHDEEEISRINVRNMVKQLLDDSLVDDMGTVVCGAFYDITTGEVSWL